MPESSLSAILKRELFKFRNVHGDEANWWNRPERQVLSRQTIGHLGKHVAKVALTEIALPVVATIAAIEAVASILLCMVTTGRDHPPPECLRTWCCSSMITLGHTVSSFFFHNFACPNLIAKESYLRLFLHGRLFPVFLRENDVRQVQNEGVVIPNYRNVPPVWLPPHPPQLIRFPRAYYNDFPAIRPDDPRFVDVPKPSKEQAVDEGVQFLRDHVLEDMSDSMREAFKMGYPTEIYEHVLAKIAYLYVMGSKKNDRPSGCLSSATNDAIFHLGRIFSFAVGNQRNEELPNPTREGVREQMNELRQLFAYTIGEQRNEKSLDEVPEKVRPLVEKFRAEKDAFAETESVEQGYVQFEENLRYYLNHFDEEDKAIQERLKELEKDVLIHAVMVKLKGAAHHEMQGVLFKECAAEVFKER